MSGSSSQNSGCGTLIGALLVIAIVIGAVLFVLSLVGHPLGLTPSVSEVFDSDRPDDYLDRHYEKVVLGYVLTAVLLLGAIGVGVVLLASTSDVAFSMKPPVRAALVGVWVAVLIGSLLAPVGPRADAEGNVPELVGASFTAAEDRLDAAGLGDPKVDADPSEGGRCRVYRQDPPAGGEADKYDEVTVWCNVKVPEITGDTAARASDRLRNAGLESWERNPPGDGDYSRCRVDSYEPAGRVAPDKKIAIEFKCKQKKKQEREPAPANTFEPEPEPELQDYSGLNCDEIGHSYAVPPGSDPEHDADGDGIACESQ